MCVMSAVMQEWGKIVPNPVYPTWPYPNQTTPYVPPQPVIQTTPQVDLENLKAILESFRIAQEAAAMADEATGEVDCVDPEKAKLIERVETLEAQVEALTAAQKGKKKRKA
jgi:hypothetical protein